MWGYEENYGSFAQFAVVDDYMCHPKPAGLSWAEASCYMATAATAYRQLFGWHPHTVRPGDPVLIWAVRAAWAASPSSWYGTSAASPSRWFPARSAASSA
ncbi:Crotonyl-CoA carboxylase/reductase [Streptomyces tendae]